MSENRPDVRPAGTPPKPRNPVEKILVRSFIVVMLVLVAVEAVGWYGHRQAVRVLQTRIAAIETDANAPAVKAEDVQSAVGGKKPSKSEDLKGKSISNGASRREIYSWFTFSPVKKRELWVYYGHSGSNDAEGPEVIEVDTDEELAGPVALTPEELAEAQKNATSSPPPGMGMGMGSRGGMPGGGGRPGPPSHDAEPGNKAEDASENLASDSSPDEKPDAEKPAGDTPKTDGPENGNSAEKDPQ